MNLSLQRRSAVGTLVTMLLVGLLLAVLAVPQPVRAANLTAGNFAELVTAITTANTLPDTDTISITADITLTSDLPTITTDINFEGGNHTINGNLAHRFLLITSGKVSINSLTVANCLANDSSQVLLSSGGAILNQGGDLTVSNSTFRDNKATSIAVIAAGGAIYSPANNLTITNSTFTGNKATSVTGPAFGGAFYNNDTVLTISNSMVTNNQATGVVIVQGGAIYSQGLTGSITINDSTLSNNQAAGNGNVVVLGGVIFNSSTNLTISNSTVNNNQSSSNGGTVQGGVIFNQSPIGSMTITNSTISNNQATTNNFGPIFGGIIFNSTVGLTITNSTISNNQATNGVGIVFGGAFNNQTSGVGTISNTTFSGNQTISAGPILGATISSFGTTGLKNSIVAGPAGSNICGTGLADLGHNLQFPDNSCGVTIPVTDPLLDPAGLQDNGGPTMTIALQPTSPALNQVPLIDCPATDQRGISRPQGMLCDIGAYEYNLTITLSPATLPNGTGGTTYSQQLSASGGTANYAYSVTTGSLPAGLTLSSEGLISGTPSTDGSAIFTVTATDANGYTGSREYTLTIGKQQVGKQAPPADLIGQLRETPDRVAANDSENLIRYTFTVKNIGQGEAGSVSLTLPIDSNLVIGFTEFDNPKAWVSSVTTQSVTISLPALANNKVISGTIVFRPNNSPVPTVGSSVTSRYSLKWTNPAGDTKTVWSNAVSFNFGEPGSNLDVSGGQIQLMTADEPNGSKIVYHSNFFIPNEPVSAWLTRPDGTSVALTQGSADAEGHFMVEVDASGLATGTYVVATYGARSEVYGSGILVVTEPGSSQAKDATNLKLKALGQKQR